MDSSYYPSVERQICSECSAEIPIGRGHKTPANRDMPERGERLLCTRCVSSAKIKLGMNEDEQPNLMGAILVGLLAAGLAAGIWYGFIAATDGWMFGIIAILTGIAVGYGVVWGSGGRRGPTLQIISIGLTVLSLFVAEYLSFMYVAEVGALSLGDFFTLYGASISGNVVEVKGELMQFESTAGIMQFIFYGIALFEAFKITAPKPYKG